MDYSLEKMQFLDTLVFEKDGILHTDIFVKETDRNGTLHYSSEHPRKMIGSLPWRQLLRVRRVVSWNTLVDQGLEEMCNIFLVRGYPKDNLVEYKQRALDMSRDELLDPKKTYERESQDTTGSIGHCKGLTDQDEFKLPPLFSFRRSCNLKDELVNPDIGSSKKDIQLTLSRPSLGHFPCLGCACCGNLLKGQHFCHPQSVKKYNYQ
ncbi:unnamed protein product [Ranitomeya imitator]|uniref:Helix-turn-helix domain-containing protein n=1 Tax=Ranitomeya imitator TaxID=111125 RepID=A0ABN9L1F7_9NEOB|nr:unnamed protein product [Ranitomeya imitator]